MEKNRETIKSRSIVRMGRKGVSIIAVAVVLMVSVIVIEGVIVNTFIADMEIMKRTAREIAVINAVDAVEFAKKALQQAVPYSFYGASDDVLRTGGFCAFDENPCEEDCKVPINVPTRDCRPWWRVYDTTYAPEYGMPSEPQLEPEPEMFAYYLFSRMSSVFNSYGSSFLSPIYCPRPPGKLTIENMGTYRIRANVTNIEDDAIKYSAENIEVAEHNTYFSDTFDASTLEIFEFARSKFVDSDPVKSAFINAADSMPNIWCDMDGDYCNMDTNCGTNCFGGNCCCKNMIFGDVCGSNMVEEFCDDQLLTYCSDVADDCDFDNDGTVSADEKYRCDVENEIYGPVASDDGTIEASTVADRCFNAKHITEFEFSRATTVNWKSEVPGDCGTVDECECSDPCIGNEEECDGCSEGITTGSFDGPCPTELPWVNKKVTCPDGCCAIEFTCTEWQEPSTCEGDNTEGCAVSGCETDPCCDYTPGCDCGECALEEWCQKNAICIPSYCRLFPACCDYTPAETCDDLIFAGSTVIGDCDCCDVSCNDLLCTDPCCEWKFREGVEDPRCGRKYSCPSCCSAKPSCDPKRDFDCDGCCNGGGSESPSCDPTNCQEFDQEDCGCSGCSWDEGALHHDIVRNCRANVCGMDCCEQTDTLYEDVTCDYDYSGSVDATVTVKDVVHEYPIGSSWSNLEMLFNVVSGNAEDCSGDVETETCCEAASTDELDMANGCKSETPIVPGGDTTSGGTTTPPSSLPIPPTPSPPPIPSGSRILHVEGTKILNENGDEVKLIGINVGHHPRMKKDDVRYENAAFAEETTFIEADVETIKSWGVSNIDIHMIWLSEIIDGSGNINWDFFTNFLDKRVEWITGGENPIYATINIADFHVSSLTWGPYTMPVWMHRDYAFGRPDTKDEMITVVHDFWDVDVSHMDDERELYYKAWETIAERYKDNPYVMYAPTNEPLHHTWRKQNGDYFSASEYQHIGWSYSRVIEATIDRIRLKDPNKIIFVDRPYPLDSSGDNLKYVQDVNRPNIVWETHAYGGCSSWNDLEGWKQRIRNFKSRFSTDWGKPVYIGEWWLDPLPEAMDCAEGGWRYVTSEQVEHLNSLDLSYSFFSHSRLYGEYYSDLTQQESEDVIEIVFGYTTIPGCVTDFDCCEQLEIGGAQVVCLDGVCELAMVGGHLCPL